MSANLRNAADSTKPEYASIGTSARRSVESLKGPRVTVLGPDRWALQAMDTFAVWERASDKTMAVELARDLPDLAACRGVK